MVQAPSEAPVPYFADCIIHCFIEFKLAIPRAYNVFIYMGVTRPLHNFLGKVGGGNFIRGRAEGSGGGQKIVAGHRSNLATAATWPLQHFIAIE